jgi:hypothetical protein
MMPALGTAELTVQERGILSTSASAVYLDCFSKVDRLLVGTFQQPALMLRTRRYYSRGQAYTMEWRDYGQPLPAWFDPLMQGFVDLLTLPPNWDSYGAGAIDPRIVQDAMDLINGLLGSTSPAPRAVPLSSGGIQLEWCRQGIDLEIVFDRGEQPFFYYRNRASGDESEYVLPENNALLRSIIGNLA